MKKIFTLLFVAGLALTSCEKDETVEAKDYTTYTVSANMNSKDGKEIPVLGHDRLPTGEFENQYYYSVQYLFNLDDDKLNAGVVNSSDVYDEIVLPKDPSTDLTQKLPVDGDWQIALTQYLTEDSYIDEGETKYQQYPVVGVLVNTNKNIEVAHIFKSVDIELAKNIDDFIEFADVDLADAISANYSKDVDEIGFDWKSLNFSNFTYEIVSNNYYLVKISDNEIYKLRFVDFYGENPDDNTKVEKGHIKFQFELLR